MGEIFVNDPECSKNLLNMNASSIFALEVPTSLIIQRDVLGMLLPRSLGSGRNKVYPAEEQAKAVAQKDAPQRRQAGSWPKDGRINSREEGVFGRTGRWWENGEHRRRARGEGRRCCANVKIFERYLNWAVSVSCGEKGVLAVFPRLVSCVVTVLADMCTEEITFFQIF